MFGFKKKVKEEPVLNDYTYTVYTKNMGAIKCTGRSNDKTRLASRLSDVLEGYDNIYVTGINGSKHVIWSKNVEAITID